MTPCQLLHASRSTLPFLFGSWCFSNFFAQPEQSVLCAEALFVHCCDRKILDENPPNFSPDSRPRKSPVCPSIFSLFGSVTSTRAWQKSSSSSSSSGSSGFAPSTSSDRRSTTFSTFSTFATSFFAGARSRASSARSSFVAAATVAKMSWKDTEAIADSEDISDSYYDTRRRSCV